MLAAPGKKRTPRITTIRLATQAAASSSHPPKNENQSRTYQTAAPSNRIAMIDPTTLMMIGLRSLGSVI